MIKIENLRVDYDGQLTLSIDRLSVESGEKVCLIGKSGSGKTTLIECLFGLRKYAGKIEADINNMSFSPQRSDLIPNFTVKTNILMSGFGKRTFMKNLIALYKDYPQIDDILKTLDISDKKYQYVKNLSGGEQQRVLIARAMYEDRGIYLMDEPTSALDAVNSRNSLGALLSCKEKHTVICSIHNLSLLDLFQRVIILKGAEVILDDRVSNVDRERISVYLDDKT